MSPLPKMLHWNSQITLLFEETIPLLQLLTVDKNVDYSPLIYFVNYIDP